MTKDERIKLIRKGNELFNKGDIETAAKIFIHTDYKDGLVRIGDYYYYEKKLPVKALEYYKKAGHKRMVDEIIERMALTIRYLLLKDSQVN